MMRPSEEIVDSLTSAWFEELCLEFAALTGRSARDTYMDQGLLLHLVTLYYLFGWSLPDTAAELLRWEAMV